MRLLGGLRDRYGLVDVTLRPEAITLENAGDRFGDQRRGRSVFNRQESSIRPRPVEEDSRRTERCPFDPQA